MHLPAILISILVAILAILLISAWTVKNIRERKNVEILKIEGIADFDPSGENSTESHQYPTTDGVFFCVYAFFFCLSLFSWHSFAETRF